MAERRFRFNIWDITVLLDLIEEHIQKALKNTRLSCNDKKIQTIYILGGRIIKPKSTYYNTYWYDNQRMKTDLRELLKEIKEFRTKEQI